MAEQGLNIYQKIAKIRKQMEVIQRDKSGYGYKYVSDDELLARLAGFIDKYHLSLIPGIVPESATVTPYFAKKTKATKTGAFYEENINEILVKADMVYTWINNDNPEERIEVPWLLIGHQSDGSQSFGSGLTYSMRYFLLKFFNCATPDDDPDKWRSKKKAAEAAEDKMVAEEIISAFDRTVKAFLSEHSDQSDKVKRLVTKYAKGGNYFSIKDPNLASKMMTDFRATFLETEETAAT